VSTSDVFRNGKVHVQRRMCSTCIFRPGNLMNLEPGRVEGMVEGAGDDGCIPCHKNLSGEGQAVCRGFFDNHKNQLLQIAERLDMIEEVVLRD
jgi:hypothetical protein